MYVSPAQIMLAGHKKIIRVKIVDKVYTLGRYSTVHENCNESLMSGLLRTNTKFVTPTCQDAQIESTSRCLRNTLFEDMRETNNQPSMGIRTLVFFSTAINMEIESYRWRMNTQAGQQRPKISKTYCSVIGQL